MVSESSKQLSLTLLSNSIITFFKKYSPSPITIATVLVNEPFLSQYSTWDKKTTFAACSFGEAQCVFQTGSMPRMQKDKITLLSRAEVQQTCVWGPGLQSSKCSHEWDWKFYNLLVHVPDAVASYWFQCKRQNGPSVSQDPTARTLSQPPLGQKRSGVFI